MSGENRSRGSRGASPVVGRALATTFGVKNEQARLEQMDTLDPTGEGAGWCARVRSRSPGPFAARSVSA